MARDTPGGVPQEREVPARRTHTDSRPGGMAGPA